MRAAIFVGEGEPLSIEEVTPRPPGPKDVTVQVLASGVCHSDLSIVNGYVPLPRRRSWATRAPVSWSRWERR